MSSIGSITSTPIDVRAMDLETAMLFVQSQRANLLENALKEQIATVNAKNEQTGKINEATTLINALVASFGTDKEVGHTRHFSAEDGIAIKALLEQANIDVAQTLGPNFDPAATPPKYEVSLGKAQTAQSTFKNIIDANGSSQQMDMLRLQGLSNKRNEAFEVMSNFIKKMQDSRSSILGNMR